MHAAVAHVQAINDGIAQRSAALDNPPTHAATRERGELSRRRSVLLGFADHARALAQFYVLCRVHEQRLVERGFADFVVARAGDYLLPTGLQAHDLEG